ncbi:hypothetical protein INT46_005951 [Mucor plumbeus]|uniref:Chromatin target of PRMT1 protein C-terminal domain-containing protein n=1 Tax=Mucor plumbeus TaxID=97098 RepID=A0A8H7R3I7_9FUNG|nr:hypothetical protein INT46_005951 [Mucor plumbeus]
MSYNNNRRNQGSNTNTRTVSYNSGGLNERFSKIVKSAVSSRPTVATNVHNNSNKNDIGGGSVFSRLRGAKTSPRGRIGSTNIQNRLGKTNSGGIKKRGGAGATPMKGVEKQKGRIAKKAVGKKQNVVMNKQGKRQSSQQQKQKKKEVKKPATADDLDRALDAYMMKDPKTAQAKLDAELTSYMDEAGDILMDENL